MQTLYISDLDGTLLTPDCTLSDQSAQILNRLIQKGLLFSIATARSASSAMPLLAKLQLRLPVILMNGAVLYDPVKKRTASVAPIAPIAAQQALAVFARHGQHPFFTQLRNGVLEVCFTELKPGRNREYYEERKNAPDKKFRPVARLEITPTADPVYFALFGSRHALSPIVQELSGIEGLSHVFYRDTYSDDWLIEAFSGKASKPAGAIQLLKQTGAQQLISFGDNLNDLPLFQASDGCYAVSNAHPDVRRAASGVIGSNASDAVARFLLENWCIL